MTISSASARRSLERLGGGDRDLAPRQGPGQGVAVAALAREPHRLGAEAQPALEVGVVAELDRQQREQRRPLLVRPRQSSRARLERLDPALVDLADDAGEAAGVGEGGARHPRAVGELAGEFTGFEQGLAVLGVAELALGVAESDHRVAAHAGVGLLGLVEDFDRALEPVEGLGRGERVERALSPARIECSAAFSGICGVVVRSQCRASSSARPPRSAPHISSSASAIRRWVWARRVAPSSS